ncbi:MAG: PEGA domain-containing protein [Deltaproteobacteria bacterium]|nr:PEGA domain-containing protein [Candidatus Zymogenaceae bacterium]
MKIYIKLTLLVIVFISLIYCYACTPCTPAKIVITSDPPGANISANDAYLGQTPISKAVIRDEFGPGSVYLIKAEKRGYLTSQKIFTEEGLEDACDCMPKAIHFQLEPDPDYQSNDTIPSTPGTTIINIDNN